MVNSLVIVEYLLSPKGEKYVGAFGSAAKIADSTKFKSAAFLSKNTSAAFSTP